MNLDVKSTEREMRSEGDKGDDMSAIWNYESRALILLSLCVGFVFFDRNAVNFLSPFLVHDLSLSNMQVGMLSSALSLTWAAFGVAVSMVADRRGRRKGYLVGAVLIFSICSFISGLATSFATLIAARALMGAAEGPVLPVAQAVMSAESSSSRRGLNMGIVQTLGAATIGGMLAPVILVSLAQSAGWRNAFLLAGVPGVLLAVAILLALREPPRLLVAGASSDAGPSHVSDDKSNGIGPRAAACNVVICVVMSCCLVTWMMLGWTFIPLYLVKVQQFSPSKMGWVMAALGASGALVGALAGPAISDRVGRKPTIFVLCLLGALSPIAATLGAAPYPIVLALAFVGWAASGAMVLVMATVPAESVSAHRISTTIAIVQAVGELVGGVAAPVLAGKAADLYGLATPLYVEAACAFGAAALALGLYETAPQVRRRLSEALAKGIA